MSEEKKTQSKKQNQKTAQEDFYQYDGGPARKKRTESKKEAPKEEPKEAPEKTPNPSSVGNQLAIIFLVVAALFLAICYAFGTKDNVAGIVGGAIRDVCYGAFGIAAFAIPFLLLQMAIFWKSDVSRGAVKYKYLVAIFFLLFFATTVHTFWLLFDGHGDVTASDLGSLGSLYAAGKALHGGGFLGGSLAFLLIYAVGYAGAIIFSLLFFAGFAMALFGLTPSECAQRIRFYRRRNQSIRKAKLEEIKRARAEQDGARRRQKEAANAKRTEVAVRRRGAGIDDEIFADDFGAGAQESGTEEILYPVQMPVRERDTREDEAVLTHAANEVGDADLSADVPKRPEEKELRVTRRSAAKKAAEASAPIAVAAPAAPAVPVEPPKPSYQFPPISLLQLPKGKVNTDASSELRENADRIVETLNSFNVHVKISNISRGPTITRYELEPEAGTRVRSILNLLDDIALSLATSGVRSDGVIAGKSAIGIEVPNKSVNTVYARELVEDPKFAEAKSRLTTGLGMDVSGAPVFLDIAKMPHLLIAGATGTGKSVCINSLLISLLYKARPDEVKLILIDPKKVELNIYNGIPHLLVPVVFDPKKAAGSLHWAVTEMERRFELLEAQNVRNIEQYNNAIANDPTKERMTQVVIIIDELADLMMTAPDDVEASICRLAQKARAAGMHLILGTQRPSVDVITGLIKANVPSRIAFRSSSQIDSRTILDQQGAEKLIGRGDMLYAPVGSDKPLRVQGAFVSEKEIEEIVEFIKLHSQECAYSGDVIEQIDKAAELCGQKKKNPLLGGTEEDAPEEEEDDPMLENAIELAVDSGKISTSLIQRRLSLGYGRAAKLIDVMESRGIVSAPDGQKPRTVLITREQYLERKMNRADDGAAEEIEPDDEPPFDL